ncbi:MAG: hypothetical protein LBJ25_06530 [Candidatus Margulisbacteria bacterium]|nr:hypothetical protein [Candidatus Margulisiibacteriota bacterium]
MDNKLEAKISAEVIRIDKLLSDSGLLFEICAAREPDFIKLSAAALTLHSFYNGLENIILLIVKNIDDAAEQDLQWHKFLFEQAFKANAKRTMVFRADLKERLEGYLYFRHFIRHSYGSELDWDRLKPLVEEVQKVWDIVKADLDSFKQNN